MKSATSLKLFQTSNLRTKCVCVCITAYQFSSCYTSNGTAVFCVLQKTG